jgi:thiamine biosynthesis lipoprotein
MVTLSLHAMATRFELVLHGADEVRLRAAGEEALQEIERLEAQLSFYRADSEITWINAHAADHPVKVEPRLFQLLKHCAHLCAATDGAFDITIGPLMRAWRMVGDTGAIPTTLECEAARATVGIHQIEFDDDATTIRFKQPGAEIDLGGYGKGYAIERAIDSLREKGITSALLHGGTSSVYGIGAPPGCTAWRIRLSEPLKEGDQDITLELSDEALSVSALHGKSFIVDDRTYGHVLDPRTGAPVSRALAAAVVGPSPAVCEALSTALLVLGPSLLTRMTERFAGYRGAVAFAEADTTVAIARLNV